MRRERGGWGSRSGDRRYGRRILPAVLLLGLGFAAVGSARAEAACQISAPALSVKRANIFTPQQEEWLGEAQAAEMEPQYMLLPTEKTGYLARLAEKLAGELPAAPYHYVVHVFESGEIRSFSLAGGQIYLSRKLVLDARNEDELAGMLAHEIGRVYTHHTATALTLQLKNLLNVKQVGGEDDVNDQFQRLLNVPRVFLDTKWKPRLSEQDQQDDELLADRVGFYAYVKAGYAPGEYASMLDRVSVNVGFRGNILTDLMEVTPVVSMRVNLAKKMAKGLPGASRETPASRNAVFTDFQAAMNRAPVNPLTAETPGLAYAALDPPMSPALENVRVSPDGRYLLAQDGWQIHVYERSPLKLLFSIDALDAQMAQFTPDSKDVVFYYSGLRFEDWSIARKQINGALDFSDYYGCLQASLSPDGFTFACFSRNWDMGWLKLTDLRTGKLVYQDLNFYRPQLGPQATGPVMRAVNEARQGAAAWSQDGRYFVASSGTANVAFDVEAQKTVNLGLDLHNLTESRMAFVQADKLAFECDWGHKAGGPLDTFKMCFTTFPGGLPLNTFTMGRTWIASVTKSPFLLTGPAEGSAAALFDPATGKLRATFPLEPADLTGDTVVREAWGGGIETGKLGGAMEKAATPVTPLYSPETAYFSEDGRFLAVSDRGRGAVWDVTTGKQTALTGPFRNAMFDGEDKLEAKIHDWELKPARNLVIDRRTGKVAPTLSWQAEQIQYGSVLVDYKPFLPEQTVDREVTIEGADAKTGAALWSRRFKWSAPLILQPDNDKQLLLVADREDETGSEEADHHRNLVLRTSDQIREFQERGLVVEVLDARTGAPQRIYVAPELPVYSGAGVPAGNRDQRSADLYGHLLTIYGNHNNSVVYNATTGKRMMAFFGRVLTADSSTGLVAGTNQPQEVSIYDVNTGKKIETVMLDNYPMAARFVPGTRTLLVLSATQRVYRIEVGTRARNLRLLRLTSADCPLFLKAEGGRSGFWIAGLTDAVPSFFRY